MNDKKLETKIDYTDNFYEQHNNNNSNYNNNYETKKYNHLINQETRVMTTNFLKDQYQYNNKNNYEVSNNNSSNAEAFYIKENIINKNDNNYNISKSSLSINELECSNNNYNNNNGKKNISILLFLDYIDNILKYENACYTLKESLSLREDMAFKELFCLFDYHQNKNISKHEFKKVCKNILSLYPTSDQVGLIFNRYDINKDEKLNLKEFLNMISPIKKEYLGILFGDKKIQKPFHSELSDKSKKIIVNLMKTIILNESNYYEIREKMKSENFSINEVWKILIKFSNNDNCLSVKDFGKFLKNYNKKIREN